MHFKGLDLNLLVVLDAMLEEESVSKAALRLNVSQPAVSAALAKLRWHTGDELLEKIGRSVKLTPRAQEMIKPVKDILIQIEATVKGSSEVDPQSFSRDFKISMTSYCAQVVLPNFSEMLQICAPHVSCVVEDIAVDTLTRVKGGELDFGVTFLQTKLLNPRENLDQLSHAPIFSDNWVLVAAASNTKITEPLDFESFRTMPYIDVRPGGIPSLVERTLDQMTNRPRPTLSVASFGLAIRSVMESQCVAIVPALMVDRHSRPHLKVVSPPVAVPQIDEHLVWHSRNDDEPGHRWFRTLLLDSINQSLEKAGRPGLSEPSGLAGHSQQNGTAMLSDTP